MLGILDVWDAGTFDPELLVSLAADAELVRNYLSRDREIFLDHDAGRCRSLLRPENPFAAAYIRHVEEIARLMADRTIRAWHYTRMTDAEVDRLRREGIELSTLESLRARLDVQVAAGALSASAAEALYAASPFNQGQRENRTHRFWMISHPDPIDDSRVERLLGNWGGEVASFWQQDLELLAQVARIGTPRVLEIAVPLAATKHSYSAGQAVVSTFARSEGATPEKHAFDLNAVQPLPAAAVLAVHKQGDPAFAAMAVTYPPGYVDVSLSHWQEVTGEED